MLSQKPEFFKTSHKIRPTHIKIYQKSSLYSDYGHFITPSKPKALYLQNLSHSPIEDDHIKDIIQIHKINKSIQNSLNPTPTSSGESKHKKSENLGSESISEENSPLFYPQEPRIHTSVSINKRCYTPKPPGYIKLNRAAWVFKFSKRQKWQSLSKEMKFDPFGSGFRLQKTRNRGKVYKGICEYPHLAPSPVRVHNIKLSN